MTVRAVGYGAGTRQYGDRPNLVRVILGETTAGPQVDSITIIETNIDDMSPQIYEHLFDRLLAAGAREVFLTPVIMKKGRPAQMLTVLCKKPIAGQVANIIFTETTSIGLRIRDSDRLILSRRMVDVTTPYGPVRVKVAMTEGEEKIIPEFEDCRLLAVENNLPVARVMQAAVESYRKNRSLT
jgi:hypothetical protein